MKKFFKEFKTFITRGNVLDMAVSNVHACKMGDLAHKKTIFF